MLAQERFEILLIDEAILPVVNCIECLLDTEALGSIHLLFQLFSHTIQSDLSVTQKQNHEQ